LTDPLSQRPVPLLTPELPGTSGIIRVAEEDFQVEELPLYEPSGVGEHLYLTVEKRGRTTPEVAREIARGLGAAEREVGTAGLKDKRAVTVQRISVKTKAPAEEALRLSGPGYRVLAAARHGNKLRPGHLRGTASASSCGGSELPAWPGRKRSRRACARSGPRTSSGRSGSASPETTPRSAAVSCCARRRSATGSSAGMALSALQSELFNRCLAARISDGLFATAVEGDVLKKRATGGCSCARTSPPTRRASRQARSIRPAAARPFAVFRPRRGAAAGTGRAGGSARRSCLLCRGRGGDAGCAPSLPYPGGGAANRPAAPDALAIAFALPKGSYAVSVLREITKSEVSQAELPEESNV